MILPKFAFSDIIKGYWMKFMAINAVTDLEDHLFLEKKQRNRKIIPENNLTFLWSAILGKKIPWPINSFNLFQDPAFDI